MDYDQISKEIENDERSAEAKIGAPATPSTEPKTSNKGTELSDKASRTVTTGIRKMICKGIGKIAEQVGKWNMEGYTERVDADELVCDAFHVAANKRAPALITKSPELVVVFGLASHAMITNSVNKAKAEGRPDPTVRNSSWSNPNDPRPHGIGKPPVNFPPEPVEIDISVHGEPVNENRFHFASPDGEMVDPPASVLVPPLVTARRRGRRPRDSTGEVSSKPPKKRTRTEEPVVHEDMFLSTDVIESE